MHAPGLPVQSISADRNERLRWFMICHSSGAGTAGAGKETQMLISVSAVSSNGFTVRILAGGFVALSTRTAPLSNNLPCP